jgi:hypothetical protein
LQAVENASPARLPDPSSFLNRPLFDYETLAQVAVREAPAYRSAEPFPHSVLDDFIGAPLLMQLLAEYPPPQAPLDWRRLVTHFEDGSVSQINKLGFSDLTLIGPALRQMFLEMTSAPFLRFLEALTGISGLLPDPHLIGGGLQQSLPGAILKIHADFAHHPETWLDRRVNVLLFLNENWKDEYGGQLELWTSDMSRCAQRIAPVAKRCVIFSTSPTSFHGVPTPLACPEGLTRKSLVLYYYTNGRPEWEVFADNDTNFQKRPQDQTSQAAGRRARWRFPWWPRR